MYRSNPSTSFIKGTILKDFLFGKFSRPRLISIRRNFVWRKGTRFKEISGGTYPDSRIHYVPIQFVLELQEPPGMINRDSIHSYSV